MNYSIRIRRKAQKSLARISQPFQAKLIEAILKLAETPYPHGCKKLSGREAWRIRVGDYRIIYEVHDIQLDIIIVEVGHRSLIYR